MSLNSVLVSAGLPVVAMIALLVGAIAFGGPTAPPPLDHIGDRFDTVNWSSLPTAETYTARDGEALSYRRYPGAKDEVILALHGSGGSGRALHPLSAALNATGATVITPDIRGHGASGRRGDVDYAGQVDDDLADLRDLLKTEYPGARLTVIGFSMGGGLALRHAAQQPSDKLILLSPYLAHDAPPMAAENPFAPASPWAQPGVGRIIGLSLINRLGVQAFDHLSVVRLATRKEDAAEVVSSYSHRMLQSVNPKDWRADLLALKTPPVLFVGSEDELHFAPAFSEAMPGADVRVIEGVDHMGLTLEPAALAAIANEVSL